MASSSFFSAAAKRLSSAALLLGAGRSKKEDAIDFSAGIYLAKKTGDAVCRGDVIATLYASDESLFAAAEKKLLDATEIVATKPQPHPLIWDIVR